MRGSRRAMRRSGVGTLPNIRCPSLNNARVTTPGRSLSAIRSMTSSRVRGTARERPGGGAHGQAYARLDSPLEAVLARVVDVVGQDALAGASEAHAFVEAVGEIEARVRPEDEARHLVRPAPVEHRLHEGAAETSSSPRA